MLGCPQVVSYRVSKTTAFIVMRKLTSPYVSLPNILADDWCVPELLQDAATAEALESALCTLIDQPRLRAKTQSAYAQMSDALKPPISAAGDPLALAVLAQMRRLG
jgi:lipid-A-disaccharide synthase